MYLFRENASAAQCVVYVWRELFCFTMECLYLGKAGFGFIRESCCVIMGLNYLGIAVVL